MSDGALRTRFGDRTGWLPTTYGHGSACNDAITPTTQRAAAETAADGLVAPAKAVRLLGMLNHGLAELHRVTLDDSARRSLIASHRAALIEVASTLSDALIDELIALRFAPLGWEATVDEIRVAQAQLLGWVNGLILAEATFATAGAADGRAARPPPVASDAASVRTRNVRSWPGPAGRGKMDVGARAEVQCHPRSSEPARGSR